MPATSLHHAQPAPLVVGSLGHLPQSLATSVFRSAHINLPKPACLSTLTVKPRALAGLSERFLVIQGVWGLLPGGGPTAIRIADTARDYPISNSTGTDERSEGQTSVAATLCRQVRGGRPSRCWPESVLPWLCAVRLEAASALHLVTYLLAAWEVLMKCMSCGFSSAEAAKFCPECGARMASSPSPARRNSGPKKCAAGPCNNPRIEGSFFCVQHTKGLSSKQIKQAQEAQRKAQQARIRCIHCQEVGYVSTQVRRVKRGVSGGKATGAVITGGLSLFATGLSRKQDVVEAHCSNCGMTWQTDADR